MMSRPASSVYMTATEVSIFDDSRRIIHMLLDQGDVASKFAADNLHKRMMKDESYEDKQYEIALKRAFLGIDEDLRASEC
jgi:hypothetical protein